MHAIVTCSSFLMEKIPELQYRIGHWTEKLYAVGARRDDCASNRSLGVRYLNIFRGRLLMKYSAFCTVKSDTALLKISDLVQLIGRYNEAGDVPFFNSLL